MRFLVFGATSLVFWCRPLSRFPMRHSIHEQTRLYMVACYAVCMQRVLLVVGVLVLVGIAGWAFWGGGVQERQTVSSAAIETAVLSLGASEVVVEVADTSETRRRGLSGREELPWGTGLFFVFDEPGEHGIWMPDMNFAIDVLWLDSDMRVVHIVEHMSPESYPEVFRSPVPALYVLEVPAGYVAAEGLCVGDVATLVE